MRIFVTAIGKIHDPEGVSGDFEALVVVLG